MVTPLGDRGGARPKWRVLLTVHVLVTLLTGLFAVSAWTVEGTRDWELFVVLFACSAAALVFRVG